jgi:hypothetical protein
MEHSPELPDMVVNKKIPLRKAKPNTVQFTASEFAERNI